MSARAPRGLLDALACVLCIAVALHRTPAGALVRLGVSWARGTHTSSEPLLGYYRATFVAPVDTSAAPTLMAASRLPPGESDARVAALVLGDEEARYAIDRVRRSGRDIDLANLAAVLRPDSAARLLRASGGIASATLAGLAWPVDEGTRVTSPFGMRLHPALGVMKMHTGVDLSVPTGTPVRAAAAGIVRRASEDGVNGRVVIVDHGHGVTTAYCHNELLLVSAGDRVEAGQVIARSGSTGRATGPHLHYQLELGGKPIDPLAGRASIASVVRSAGAIE